MHYARKEKELRFRNESQLYAHVCSGIRKYKKSNIWFLDPIEMSEDKDDSFLRRYRLERRRVYLYAEVHGSMKPAAHVHRRLAQAISSEPGDWLFLSEASPAYRGRLEPNWPSPYYFRMLAAMNRIPCENPIPNLFNESTRRYLSDASGLSNEEIDRMYLKLFINSHNTLYRHAYNRMIANIRKRPSTFPSEIAGLFEDFEYGFYPFKLTPTYLARLIEKDPPDGNDFVDTVDPHWNRLADIRFRKLLGKYSERSCILVNVGISHAPAFEPPVFRQFPGLPGIRT